MKQEGFATILRTPSGTSSNTYLISTSDLMPLKGHIHWYSMYLMWEGVHNTQISLLCIMRWRQNGFSLLLVF